MPPSKSQNHAKQSLKKYFLLTKNMMLSNYHRLVCVSIVTCSFDSPHPSSPILSDRNLCRAHHKTTQNTPCFILRCQLRFAPREFRGLHASSIDFSPDLEGLSKTLDAINKSISRLAQLRHTKVCPTVVSDFSKSMAAFFYVCPWLLCISGTCCRDSLPWHSKLFPPE